MAELGWLGAAIPEAHGGLGFAGLSFACWAEEIGRAVAPIPFSSTVYFFAEALLLAGDEMQKAAHLPKVASGDDRLFALSEGPGAWTAASIEAKFDGAASTV